MRLYISWLVYSFCFFVVTTSQFPDVDNRYIFSIFVTDGIFSCFSINPEYIVSSSMLWIGTIVALLMN